MSSLMVALWWTETIVNVKDREVVDIVGEKAVMMAELLWSELREATMTNSFSNSDGGGWCGILGVVERIRGEGCGKMELRAIRSF